MKLPFSSWQGFRGTPFTPASTWVLPFAHRCWALSCSSPKELSRIFSSSLKDLTPGCFHLLKEKRLLGFCLLLLLSLSHQNPQLLFWRSRWFDTRIYAHECGDSGKVCVPLRLQGACAGLLSVQVFIKSFTTFGKKVQKLRSKRVAVSDTRINSLFLIFSHCFGQEF